MSLHLCSPRRSRTVATTAVATTSDAASADAATSDATTSDAAGVTGSHGRRLAAVWAPVAAAAVALTVLAVPQSASARTTTHATTATEARIETSVFTMINAERRAHHLHPVTRSHALRMSARGHDVTMARFNQMSHQLPREAFFANRMTKAGYHWTWAGENIGWNSAMNTDGVRALETAMYNERPPADGHRRNILNPHFRNVGVDVYVDHVHHKIWLTTDYGRR